MMGEWLVYIIRCDQSAFYTGITTDVARRIREHRSGNRKAAKYTRAFSSLELVYKVLIGDRSLAAKIEYQIKKLPRQKKEFIVSSRLSPNKLMAFLDLGRE